RGRLAEHAILERHAVAPCPVCLLAAEHPRDIDLPLVPFVRRVGAFDVAELALPAEIADCSEILRSQALSADGAPLDIAVDARKHVWERPAVVHAHPAVVTDLEEAPELPFEIRRIPEAPIVRNARRGFCGFGIDLTQEGSPALQRLQQFAEAPCVALLGLCE